MRCATLGWPDGCSAMGLDGAAVALPASLPAGSSALYLRAVSTWRR